VREARRPLVAAQEIAVNLTGGTTLMGLAVAAIANEAQRLGRDVRRFGLVDRRPPSEQDANPYRAGEAFWLDPRSSHGD
jgi:thioesterase domain-containing protein